jgi:hypothetical protein
MPEMDIAVHSGALSNPEVLEVTGCGKRHEHWTSGSERLLGTRTSRTHEDSTRRRLLRGAGMGVLQSRLQEVFMTTHWFTTERRHQQ